MFRFSFLSWRLFFFTYCQSFFTTSVRGSGLSPTIFARAAEGCMAFMKAALGLRAVFLAAGFLAAAFLAAIRFVLPRGSRSPLENRRTLTEEDPRSPALFPSGNANSLSGGPRQPLREREILSTDAPSRLRRTVSAAFLGAAFGSHSRCCFSEAR